MLMFGRKKAAEASPLRCEEQTVAITRELVGKLWVDTALATHIGTRKYQQDAAYVSEALLEEGDAFAILCDGMGGMEAGELVSADVVEFFANQLAGLPAGADVPSFYAGAILDANAMVLKRYVQKGCEGGTTLVSALIRGEKLYWAAVGDSRIYILRGGEIARVTRDHNYALRLQSLVEAGSLSQEEADSDPQRDALVSYLGAPILEMVDISRGSFELLGGDLVLLCSDGLTKPLRDGQILALLTPPPERLAEAAHRLTAAAMDASPAGQDNTSVILMRYFGPPKEMPDANRYTEETLEDSPADNSEGVRNE